MAKSNQIVSLDSPPGKAGSAAGSPALAPARADLSLGAPGVIVPSPDFQQIQARWSSHLRQEYSEHTRKAYLNAIDKFAAWIHEQESDDAPISMADVRRYHIVAYQKEIKSRYSLNTVNLQLCALRQFYDWAIGLGAPLVNPASGVKIRGRTSLGAHKRDSLSDEEVQRLLKTCCDLKSIDLRDRLIMNLMLYCALRTIEVQRARFGDLEVRQGRQILWVWRKGHSEPDDFVVLPKPLEISLHDWVAVHPAGTGPILCTLGRNSGRQMSLRTLRSVVKKRMHQAGIRGTRKSTHSLRHTAITSAINHGSNPIQVRRMAGHVSIRTTLAYFHETDRIEDPAEDRIQYGIDEGEQPNG